jgi:predicted RNA binding protein with dsRBD fold (UPF0201 family)
MYGMRHEGVFRTFVYSVTDGVSFVTIQEYAEKSIARDAARRRVILDAARDCILKFGYAKSSLEDIAKQAAISSEARSSKHSIECL